MRRAAAGALVAGALLVGAAVPAGAGGSDRGTIVTLDSVTDGDTIRLTDDSRVRLIGIDTPEVSGPYTQAECLGRQASDFTRSVLRPGDEVRLVFDREHQDRYGRLLAYVYRESDDLFVNAEILRKGFARLDTVEPNTAHLDQFERIVDKAQDKGRGIWGKCDQG